MKKIYTLLVLSLIPVSFLLAQRAFEVKNIVPEQKADKIYINYEIVNSNVNQLFSVEISVKTGTGTGSNFVLKSVTGDVGEAVVGGKSTYQAVWDVRKDLDRLTSAEFTVVANLTKDNSVVEKPQKEEKPAKVKEEKPVVVKETKPISDNQKFSILRYDKENKGQWFAAVETWGIKGGYRGKWGFGLLAGQDLSWFGEFTLLADVSKSLIRKRNFQWSIYPVFGYTTATVSGYGQWVSVYDEWGNYLYEMYVDEYWEEKQPSYAVGLGTDVCIGHLYFNIDLFVDKASDLRPFAGIGWRF